jgi:hypothetical protein
MRYSPAAAWTTPPPASAASSTAAVNAEALSFFPVGSAPCAVTSKTFASFGEAGWAPSPCQPAYEKSCRKRPSASANAGVHDGG